MKTPIESESKELIAIPFTQYMMPNGRQVPVNVERPKHIADKAHAIIKAGGKFTVEMLNTGEISIATEYDHADYDIELTSNGPEVLNAVDKMINRVYRSLITNASLEPQETL